MNPTRCRTRSPNPPAAFLACAAFFISFSVRAAVTDLAPVALRCDHSVDPLGVDADPPRLFWKLTAETRGQRQTGYRVLAASSAGLLDRDEADLWDSGKVTSDATVGIPYAGQSLKSSEQVFWKVKVWDRAGIGSSWSPIATWTMGILAEDDWHAGWIAASTNTDSLLLRREVNVRPNLKRALLHVCGLGQYEAWLNGVKTDDDLLSPGWTRYDRTCLYDTRDVTALVRPGTNAVGLLLGNGMYNVHSGRYTKFVHSFGPLRAIAQLRLEYADGQIEMIGTDDQWHVRAGPITFSSIYGGEDFDARLVPEGWDRAGFNEAGFEPARLVPGPGGTLKGHSSAAPPIRAFQSLLPAGVNVLPSGATVYDLGQNAPVMPRLTVKGPPGSYVRIIPAELVKTNGAVDRMSTGGPQCFWQYTLAGRDRETWFPDFFYHGCRYLQVERFPANGVGELPSVERIEGVVVHSTAAPVGDFECSNELFNRIHHLVRWAQLGNLMSVITDCPHRERMGWLEQDHLNGPALRYEFDMSALFTKTLQDIADSQSTNGLVPDTAPEYTVLPGGFRDSPEWGSACILVPWQEYEFTGDRALLTKYYPVMRRYVSYLQGKAVNDILDYGLGDWYDIGPKKTGFSQLTPAALTATAFYCLDNQVLARVAEWLNRPDEAIDYGNRAARIRTAFTDHFYHAATHRYATGSQTANAIPLAMGWVDPANRASVLNAIIEDVRSRGNALTAGDVGYRYLLRALAQGGRSDVIFDINNQSDKPGYGYQLKMGATSLTEAWNADRRFSQNHLMLGQIVEWFYHDLAGISLDPAAPGFKNVIIDPQPVGNVTWVNASYDSVRGKIVCNWKRDSHTFTLDLVVPANTTATVFLPAHSPRRVKEGNRQARHSPGVKLLRFENGRAVFDVQSGHYHFQSSP